ncbi:MAG: MFS transporter [Gammaproteobacteria bacterium]|nr:MFS transporter [Gammaproteobacteria bacterium]
MSTGQKPAAGTNMGAGYQVMLVVLLSFHFGIVFFDRQALNFLMPAVQPDLGLNNTQIGLLAGLFSFAWALAAFGIGYVSDRTGSRKGLLIGATLVFSACSFLSGLAQTFMMMLGARLLMGIAEGGIMPISQSLIVSEVSEGRRGLAQGFTQNFGSNLLGSFIAPVLLAYFVTQWGWRNAFFLAGVPGLVAAVLIWWLVKEPAPVPKPANGAARKLSFREAFAERNVLLSALIGVIMVSYFVVCFAFMPLYLAQARHFDSQTQGWLMGVLGLSATIGSLAISGLSDRIGRRPLMILMPLIGVILPLGAMYFQGSVWVLAAIFFVGWGLVGIFPLFMATIPSESVDREHSATVMGLCMGVPEVLGGALAPALTGYATDLTGSLTTPRWIMFGLTIIGGLLGFGIRETAPRVLARRSAAA